MLQTNQNLIWFGSEEEQSFIDLWRLFLCKPEQLLSQQHDRRKGGRKGPILGKRIEAAAFRGILEALVVKAKLNAAPKFKR
jgi:hypothetical protein